MRWPLSLILLCANSILLCHSYARQPYTFSHIDQSNGLLNNNVWSIAQDKHGYIWIGMQNGLQRYDGSRFMNYSDGLIDPGDGIVNVGHLYSDDAHNRLWLLTPMLVKKLDLFSHRYTNHKIADLVRDSSFKYNTYKDKDGNPWLLGSYYFFHIDAATNNAISYGTCQPYGKAPRSLAMANDYKHKKIWVIDPGYGLLMFNDSNNTVNSIASISFPRLPKKDLNLVMIDSHQNLWVSTWSNSFYRYDLAKQELITYSLPVIHDGQKGIKNTDLSLFVNDIFEDDHGNVWIGTNNAGLLEYDRKIDGFKEILVQENNSLALQYNYEVNCIFQDKEENIWIGTDKGISIFNPYRQYFTAVRYEPGESSSIPKREINSFIETKNGDILVGTWGGGISVYDNQLHFKKTITFNGTYEENMNWCFIEDDEGKIWAGCQHGYIHIINKDGSITTLHPPELENKTARCMQKDSAGNIWIGLHNGNVAKWDKKENRFYPYGDMQENNPQVFAAVSNIFIDHAQNIWVGTENAFKQFDPERRTFKKSYFADNTPGSICGNVCQGIEEVNDSTLLIATVNGGLNYFNTRSKTFSHVGYNEGLPANSVYALKKDTAGYIWFTTDYGIYKFLPGSTNFIAYNLDKGTINSSFQANHFYITRDGRWLTSTFAEMISFYPYNLSKQNDIPLPVTITGFKIFDQPILVDSILYATQPIRLSYTQNFINIEFASLSYSNISQIRYYYQLVGIDKDWVNAGMQRFASYTDLRSGEYTFQVKAQNGNNVGAITSFKIIITPPFWRTLWFVALCLGLVFWLIYLLTKWRIAVVRRQEMNKALVNRQLAEIEMKALRAQMNPHFIFNCINSIDALIQSNDKYHATVYLNKFAKLIRNILDSSRQNTVTLAKDLETLKLYVELEQLRNENKFTATIEADDNLIQDDYKVPPLIIQPYVENAILHGLRNRPDNNGKLLVSISRQNGHLQYIIEDNGVGRPGPGGLSSNEKDSYGMQMSSDRVKIFNNEKTASVEITDLNDNGHASGTRVQVLLKIQ